MSQAIRFRVHESLSGQRRIRTTDALRTPPTPAEAAAAQRRPHNPDMLGHLQWTGDLAPVGRAIAQVLDALRGIKDERKFSDALNRAIGDLAAYGSTMATSELRAGGAGSFGTGGMGSGRPEKEFGSAPTPEELQEIHDRHYATGAPKAAARDMTRAKGRTTSVAQIQAMNERFWGAMPKTQSREWGKG